MNRKKHSNELTRVELKKIRELLFSDTDDLSELARIAGADSKIFYRGANFRDADLTNENLESFDLTLANLSQCKTTSGQQQYLKKYEIDHKAHNGIHLSDLFSLEAWHDKFESDTTTRTDLYVRVHFFKAEMSIESKSEVNLNFDIGLRRANITVQASVENGFELNNSGLITIVDEKSGIEVVTSVYKDDIQISLKPNRDKDVLQGAPWPDSQSIYSFMDRRNKKQKEEDLKTELTAPIIVSMSCNREDLVFSLKQPNDGGLSFNDQSLAAVESYIRDSVINTVPSARGEIELASLFSTTL